MIARISGTASTGTLLVTAHYDGREVALAAGDDGAGVISILEAVRALISGAPVQNDIIVLITDAEEVGLMGARAFANQHPWMDEVKLVLSIEMRGGGGPSIMFETGRENGWVVQEYAAASPAPTMNSLSYEIYKRLPNDTDFSPFRDAGIQGLNFAAIGRAHVYHQQYDNAENLSARTVQHHGVQALALLRHFGSADLSGSLQAPDRVHFAVPFLGAVTYAPWVSSALSVLLGLLAAVSVVVGRKGGARVVGIAVGLGLALAVVAVGVGAGYGLAQWLPRFHAETGALHGSRFHSEGWYVTSLVAVVCAAVFATLAIAKRRFSIGELAVGAALVPVLVAIASGFLAPMAAMNFQWPALAALIGATVVGGVGRAERVGLVSWIVLLLLAIPTLVFLGPLVEILWLAMNISLAPALGGVIALTLLCMFALTDVAREPNGWWATGGALVVAAALLGVGLAMARPSASRPEPSTLIYAVDKEAGTSAWAMDAQLMADSGSEMRAGLVWAIEHGGTPDAQGSLQPFTGAPYAVATASAPATTPAALAVSLTAAVGDSLTSLTPGSTATLQVRSNVGAELLLFLMPENGARIVSINGRPIGNSAQARIVRHWGEPEGALAVEVRLPATGPATFAVVEHLFRPEELVGPAPFARPPELAPNINRLSDRAMIRTVIVVDPETATVSFAGGGVPADLSPDDLDLTAIAATPTRPSDASITTVTDVGAGADVTVALFARDRVSSVDPEFAISFTPDGRTAYFNRTSADRSSFQLLTSILTRQGWSAPEPAPFSGSGRDIDPFVTPEGDRIYFSSDRPRAGAPAGSFSVWYSDRTPSGWSPPVDPGPPFNSDSSDVFVSAAQDGTTVFSSTRAGSRRIYETRAAATGWTEPTVIRFGSVEGGSNPLISPDGSFIVFAMEGPIGGFDFFVSCRDGAGSWGAPALLPEPINSPFAEMAPALHPDGSLLFTSERPGILGPVPAGIRPAGDVYQTNGPVDFGCS